MNPKSKQALLSIFTFFIISLTFTAHAFVMRNLSLAELAGFSQSVFTGTVSQVETGVEVSGKEAIRYTFNVMECLKGNCTNGTVSFNQLANSLVGAPKFKKDTVYTIFLARESREGFTNPVALEQGVVGMAYQDNRWVIPDNAQNRGFVNKLAQSKTHTSLTRSVNGKSSYVTLDALKQAIE
ncbi:hypothetical protein K1X76_08855 [bacterium]|nr:hypothetical protein [bacterium]